MQTRQIIRASADVVTITSLREGDVYKRVHTQYSGSEPALRFGIVTGTMNNGEDAAVTALELSPEYGSISVQQQVFTGDSPAALFPATPEEIENHFAAVRKAVEDSVEAAYRTVREAEEKAELVIGVMSRFAGQLTAPETQDALEVKSV